MSRLVAATDAQRRGRDALTWPEWGQALTQEQWLAREIALRDHPWSRAGMESWLWQSDAGETRDRTTNADQRKRFMDLLLRGVVVRAERQADATGLRAIAPRPGTAQATFGAGRAVAVASTSSSAATLIVGLSPLNAPFKGGALVPAPLLLVPLLTNAAGASGLPFTWPANVPAGRRWTSSSGSTTRPRSPDCRRAMD